MADPQARVEAATPTISPEEAFNPAVPIHYCNLVNVVGSISDFCVNFGRHTVVGKAQIELAIYLSPTTSKQLLAILQENVKSYEELFGEIPIGPKVHG